jgi:demethylmenaquinone methyltransferase / 2-methoxy-6-polyprenyl-1,4-benzoquinol methylase
MTQLAGQECSTYIQTMFARIAAHYDLMNRLMTGGQDIRWRKRVIELARLTPDSYLLDLGTGTGDLAREALTQFPSAKVIAADFTLEMMRIGQSKGPLNFSSADVLYLPLPDSSFDAVISAFLVRNVVDLQKTLEEQYRVLKQDGRIIDRCQRSLPLSARKHRRIRYGRRPGIMHGVGRIQENQL